MLRVSVHHGAGPRVCRLEAVLPSLDLRLFRFLLITGRFDFGALCLCLFNEWVDSFVLLDEEDLHRLLLSRIGFDETVSPVLLEDFVRLFADLDCHGAGEQKRKFHYSLTT